MMIVTSVADLPGVAPETVWSVIVDGPRTVTWAPHVLSVTPGDGGARWAVLLNGSRVDWLQSEIRQAPYRLAFQQVSGDLDQLCGAWSLSALGDGVRVRYEIAFNLGVDGLAPLLDPIWAQSFQAHADALVLGLTREIREERR